MGDLPPQLKDVFHNDSGAQKYQHIIFIVMSVVYHNYTPQECQVISHGGSHEATIRDRKSVV